MSQPRPDQGAGDGSSGEPGPRRNFIQLEIERDLERGVYPGVHTRFPPEPNGYLHIGHAKAICTVFGLAEQYGGVCNLRFDDTNPAREEEEYVDSIQEDIRWLGFDWEDRLFFASDFFDRLYAFAEHLVRIGDAYVDDQSVADIRAGRGDASNPSAPGVDSPFRGRSPEANLDLLSRMQAGEFEDGARVLRAKLDMGAANLLMRDPVLYRILRATHHRTGDAWCIYPTYDMAHGQCDAFEGITHSLCTVEFENHRPLYDWLRDRIPAELLDVEHRPRQIEFARLNLSYTIIGKRKLRELVEEGLVSGWDDPRMPTLRGLRRRGYTPEAIRALVERVGLAKTKSTVELAWLEDALRADLNARAQRRMAVLRPLKVVLTNVAEGESLPLEAVNNPEDAAAGVRPLALTRELWIERDDFLLDAPSKFFRLKPDGEVRLRYGFVIHCDEVVQNASGEVTELRCTYDPATAGGATPEGRKKVKGIVHWVSAADALEAEVRLYDHLVRVPDPSQVPEGGTWKDNLNPDSLRVLRGCRLEPALAGAAPVELFQFERVGYFCLDPDSRPGALVFNRSVSLRDTWAKEREKAEKA
jgi:glutaminyl-tRNA synthetase